MHVKQADTVANNVGILARQKNIMFACCVYNYKN